MNRFNFLESGEVQPEQCSYRTRNPRSMADHDLTQLILQTSPGNHLQQNFLLQIFSTVLRFIIYEEKDKTDPDILLHNQSNSHTAAQRAESNFFE